jgi:hypothetical protein
MENRIGRKSDESLYQPKVHSDRVRELYNLKQITGMPMTVLLDQAIRDLTASYGVSSPLGEEPILEKVDQETWEEICEYRKFLDQLEYQRCLDELEEIMSKDKEGMSMVTQQEPINRGKEVTQTIYQAK